MREHEQNFVLSTRTRITSNSSNASVSTTGTYTFSRKILSSTSNVKEVTDGLVARHLAIRLDSVLQAEQLPAGVTDLDTSLSYVNANGFSHLRMFCVFFELKRLDA